MSHSKTAPLTTVVLMSKTGSGKSSTANKLFRSNDFAVGRGMKSETSQCQGQMKFIRGRNLLVVDTPGTMDVKDPTMPQAELLHALNTCPNGVDAFLLVIRGDCRFTDEEYRALKDAVEVFGPEAFKRAIVVFSHGDYYDNDVDEFKKELEDSRSAIPGLDEMMNRFGNRFVLLDSRKKCDEEFTEKQVVALLSLVDEVGLLNKRKYEQSDLDKQTEQRKHEKEETERMEREKQRAENQLRIDLISATAELKAMKSELQRRDNSANTHHAGYGPVTEFLSGVGSALGAIAASPIAGAAHLLSR